MTIELIPTCRGSINRNETFVNNAAKEQTHHQSRVEMRLLCVGMALLVVSSAGPCGTSTTTSFTKYSSDKPVCLILNNTQNSSANYMAFYPEVDTYTLLHSTNCKYSAFGGEIDLKFVFILAFELFHPAVHNYSNVIDTIQIAIEIGGITSSYVHWYRDGYTASFFTLVATLSNGIVTALDWDNGCFVGVGTCTKCINDERDCALSNSTCSASSINSTSCDIKFYMAWKGTDSTGQYLTSSGKTISKFRSYSAASFYQTLLDVPNDIVLK